jgi:hypothetical protein
MEECFFQKLFKINGLITPAPIKTSRDRSKAYYQAFFWVLIDLIVELLGLIIKPFDNQIES